MQCVNSPLLLGFNAKRRRRILRVFEISGDKVGQPDVPESGLLLVRQLVSRRQVRNRFPGGKERQKVRRQELSHCDRVSAQSRTEVTTVQLLKTFRV